MGRAAEKPDPALVRMVRELLDRIAAAEGQENDVREEVLEAAGDEFDALAGPELVPALLRAVGRSQARRTRAVLLLCSGDPSADAIEVMRVWITDPSPEVRSPIIQSIRIDGLEALAPLLADRMAPERGRSASTRTRVARTTISSSGCR